MLVLVELFIEKQQNAQASRSFLFVLLNFGLFMRNSCENNFVSGWLNGTWCAFPGLCVYYDCKVRKFILI